MCLVVVSWEHEGMGETYCFYNTEKVINQKIKKFEKNLCYSALSFQTENRNNRDNCRLSFKRRLFNKAI